VGGKHDPQGQQDNTEDGLKAKLEKGPDFPPCAQRLRTSIDQVLDNLGSSLKATTAAQKEVSTCSPFKGQREALKSLHKALCALAEAYQNMVCEFRRLETMAQPLSYAEMRAEIDKAGRYLEAALWTFGAIKLKPRMPGEELETAWKKVREHADKLKSAI